MSSYGTSASGAPTLNGVVHRSLFLPIFCVIGAVTIAIGCYTPFAVVDAAIDDAVTKGVEAAQQVKALRVFYSDSVVLKAVKGGVKASPNYKDDPTAIPVPTTFILDATRAFSTDEQKIGLVSPYPWPMRAGRVLDGFQREAWARLARDPTAQVSRRETIDGREVLRVAVGDRMDAGCVACHNSNPLSPKRDWKVGDVRGIIEVVRPIDTITAGARQLSMRLVAGVVLAGVALLGALLAAGRRLVRPMHDLAGVIDRIAEGALDQGVPHAGRADEIGTVARALLNLREQTRERLRAEATIGHMARHDGLTGLPNRSSFTQAVSRCLSDLGGGGGVALFFIDLDRFKAVNDTLGHAAGDQLLQAVAGRLKTSVPDGLLLARLGGDEFALALPDRADGLPARAAAVAAGIIAAIGPPFETGGRQLAVGASIGIAVGPQDGCTIEALLKNADLALYRSKSEGGGTHCFFDPSMDARVQARRALELDLRRALPADEFELHYRPIVHIGRDEVCGCEALLRWRHPRLGVIAPARFIPLAEETGEIEAIGAFVIRTACREAATWPPTLRVAVKLSPAQFRSGAVALHVVAALAETGLAADRLELEIAEGVLLQDGETAVAVLRQLRALGVRIALDDFGAASGSLGTLRKFPFGRLKIDRSFVGRMREDEGSAAIVGALLDLGAAMGMVTTAGGVETAEQLARLGREGCVEAQGPLLGGPVPAAELRAAIAGRVPARAAAAR